MTAEWSARLVRRWIALYTRGLPAEMQRDRRDEIEDDLWCQKSDAATSGHGDRSLAGAIVTRLLLGIPADVSWRLAQRRPVPVRTTPVRSPIMNARFAAAMAMAGGVGWLVWPIPQAIYGDAGWSGSLGWLLFFSVVGGTWALTLAVLSLVLGQVDKIRGGAAVAGALGALIGGVSVFGAFTAIVALPLGSAVVMWEMGRIGAIGKWLAWAHVATAVVSLVPIAVFVMAIRALADTAAAVTLFALVMPYAVTWIAIGWALIHQPSSQRGTAAGA